METYKLVGDAIEFGSLKPSRTVIRVSDGAAIPFVMANRDCVKFLADWKAGAVGTVKNPDGSDAPYSDAAVTALGLDPAQIPS